MAKRTPRLARAVALELLLLFTAFEAVAAPISVNQPPRAPRNAPEEFYAIPEDLIADHLSNRGAVLERLRRNPRRPWGPYGPEARLDTGPGQWRLFPVCRGEVRLPGKRVEDTQTWVVLPCQ